MEMEIGLGVFGTFTRHSQKVRMIIPTGQYYKVDPSFLPLNSNAIRASMDEYLRPVYRIP